MNKIMITREKADRVIAAMNGEESVVVRTDNDFIVLRLSSKKATISIGSACYTIDDPVLYEDYRFVEISDKRRCEGYMNYIVMYLDDESANAV